MKTRLFIIAFLCFFSPNAVFAEGQPDITINEISWMGTKNSSNDEWVELKNNAAAPIDLSGWRLESIDGTPKINLTGIVPEKGFYLLERTNDDSVPGIPANQIYTGALGNSGETLRLYDKSGRLIDEAPCKNGWFAGDNSTKKTMERRSGEIAVSADGWKNSQSAGGTPGAENSNEKVVAPENKTTATNTAAVIIKKESAKQSNNAEPARSPLSPTDPGDRNGFPEKTASAGDILQTKNKSPVLKFIFTVFISIFFAVLSGSLILFYKRLRLKPSLRNDKTKPLN